MTLATGSDDEHFGTGLLAAMSVAFFLGFVAVAIALIILRRREQRTFVAIVPQLAQRYGMPASEAVVFSDWRTLRAYRKALARPVRKQFDAVHAALARLSLLHQRRGEMDPNDERILATQLDEARRRIDR